MSFVQIAQSWMRNCWILHWVKARDASVYSPGILCNNIPKISQSQKSIEFVEAQNSSELVVGVFLILRTPHESHRMSHAQG